MKKGGVIFPGIKCVFCKINGSLLQGGQGACGKRTVCQVFVKGMGSKGQGC